MLSSHIKYFLKQFGYPVLVLVVIATLFSSCNRISKKSHRLINRSEQEIKSRAEDTLDKLFPEFNSDTPDTKANKKRFADFIQVELTNDIHDIYCSDDAIGADASYRFVFKCDSSTVNNIIQKHSLKPDTTQLSYNFIDKQGLKWWDIEKIKKLPAYSWNNDQRYYKYLWYDQEESKAYYFDFDM